ncbi:MAG: DUF1778 domain-containing protein [Acidobacteriota bacterium]|nr:DUF1778 domain-containing protein [Acidobacteriota bacterium]
MDQQTAERKKPLGIRATPEQHRVIAEAAQREHRSVNSFVLHAAMQAAAAPQAGVRTRRPQAEIDAAVAEAQELMKKYRQPGRSLVEELIAERRAEAGRE